MGISPKTTISQLLDAHPFLLDYLVAYNPRFELLKKKVMRATMGKMATLERVAGTSRAPHQNRSSEEDSLDLTGRHLHERKFGGFVAAILEF